MSPAIRVEPALLRAVRHLTGTDVGSEAGVWSHKKVQTNPLALRLIPGSFEHYKKMFYLPMLYKISSELVALITKYHSHLSPVILHEELLNFINYGIITNQKAENSKLFMQRLIKTCFTDSSNLSEDIICYALGMRNRFNFDMQNILDERIILYMAAHAICIDKVKKIDMPSGIDMEQLQWLFGVTKARRHFYLLQKGDVMWLEGNRNYGSPIAEIEADIYVHIKYENSGNIVVPIEDFSIPLNIADASSQFLRITIATDRSELEIDLLQCPAWADAVGRDQWGLWASFRIDDIKQVMRWMPPSEFIIQSSENESDRQGNKGRQGIQMTKGFWLADTSCTQSLWLAVMGNNPSCFTSKNIERPVERVSWNDVQNFLTRLNYVKGGGFRLPLENEWEYACFSGTTHKYGDISYINDNEAYSSDFCVHHELHQRGTVGVKDVPCNRYGLYQMHGNVWEWCDTDHDDNSGDFPHDKISSSNNILGRGGAAMRGDSWIDNALKSSPASRDLEENLNARFGNVGFRLARSQTEVLWELEW